MSNPTYRGSLSDDPLKAVKGLFLSVLARPLQTELVDFALDPVQSQLIITGRDASESGVPGIYTGEYRWTYNKADLGLALKGPLSVEVDFPLSYRQLKSALKTRYGFEIQEKEFALSQGGTPLSGDDMVSGVLQTSYSQFFLYPTPFSPRFSATTPLRLIFIQPNKRVPLRAYMDFNKSSILPLLMRK